MDPYHGRENLQVQAPPEAKKEQVQAPLKLRKNMFKPPLKLKKNMFMLALQLKNMFKPPLRLKKNMFMPALQLKTNKALLKKKKVAAVRSSVELRHSSLLSRILCHVVIIAKSAAQTPN